MTDATVATAVREALADGEVGLEILPRDLVAVDGVGAVETDGGRAMVTVTLPLPRNLRPLIERDIRGIVDAIDGVTTVEIRFDPDPVDLGASVDFIPEVSNIIAVGSAKGGVGKSTVAVNLAAALADTDAAVGLIDADVYGPNAPSMLGLEPRTPATTRDDLMVPREAHGLKVMSMAFIVEEDDPVIWRGPLVDDFLKQLFDDVAWGDLDYLVVDMPPGTGDAQLSLVQHLPVAGAVVVTTPDQVAIDDARRGLQGFANYNVPILGVVENMSRFECPDCGAEHAPFGEKGADRLVSEFDVPILGRLPLDPEVGSLRTDEDAESIGISLPLVGQLQLPRTRKERERPTSLPPVALREESGRSRRAFELLAARTMARLNVLATDRRN